MSPAPIRGVLFDAAGTLIRPRESVGETYARLAAQHGVRISAWRLDDAFRRVHAKAPPMVFPDAEPEEIAGLEREWWRALVRQTFLAADSAARPDFGPLFDALWRIYSEPASWALLPGADAVLETLRGQGRRLGVVSNFDGRLPRLLDALGLGRFLDGVFLPGNTGLLKPDPRAFLAATRTLGVAPAECAHVGDDPERDVRAARDAGLLAVDPGELATLADLPARLGPPAPDSRPPPEPDA